MVTMDEMQGLLFAGGDVVGPDGTKIGTFGQVFLDAATGEPAWATVTTGMFGTGESFVPLADAAVRDGVLQVAHDKATVKHAPRIEGGDGALTPDEERRLYRHYGLLHDDYPVPGEPVGEAGTGPVVEPPIRPIGTPAAPPGVSPLAPPGTPSATEGSVDLGAGARSADGPAATSGDDRVDAPAATDDDAMVLRAEHAAVIGTERVPTERVRLRRYTVTEQREIQVPVTREEFRLEYEPADGAGQLPVADDDRPAGSGTGEPADR